MNLKEILNTLAKIAKKYDISTPYIVGGIPRDLVLGQLDSLNDIDITTGREDVHRLADIFAKHMNVHPKIFKDTHRKVRVGDYSIDFSSHITYKDIDILLSKRGIAKPNHLERDAYSRDFTINTLLLPLDFSGVLDPTGQGINDAKNKVLRCPLSCNIALKESPNRIVRAFYYAAKYDLRLSDTLKSAIKTHIDLLDKVKDKYASDKIAKAAKMKPSILDELIELGVLHKIPLTKELGEQLIKSRRLHEVL